MKLYFLNSDDERELVSETVETAEDGLKLAVKDLKTRRPGFITYYQRYWLDDNDDIWIDYGSHTEFYIVEKE